MDIKCSIVISVLESYEVVARQIRHFDRILPNDWELILMDDGSEPSIHSWLFENNRDVIDIISTHDNIRLFETNKDRIAWHQPQARNEGAIKARGEYLFLTDVDHVVTKEAIESVCAWSRAHSAEQNNVKKMMFNRTWGVLDEAGTICTDVETLKFYGLKDELIGYVGSHCNTFAMPKEVFLQCPYLEKYQGFYGGDDVQQAKDYGTLAHRNGWKTIKGGMMYVYPDPRNNFIDFHKLRKYKIETGSYKGYWDRKEIIKND